MKKLAIVMLVVLTVLSPFAILFLAYVTRDIFDGWNGYLFMYNLLLFCFAFAIPITGGGILFCILEDELL